MRPPLQPPIITVPQSDANRCAERIRQSFFGPEPHDRTCRILLRPHPCSLFFPSYPSCANFAHDPLVFARVAKLWSRVEQLQGVDGSASRKQLRAQSFPPFCQTFYHLLFLSFCFSSCLCASLSLSRTSSIHYVSVAKRQFCSAGSDRRPTLDAAVCFFKHLSPQRRLLKSHLFATSSLSPQYQCSISRFLLSACKLSASAALVSDSLLTRSETCLV